MLLLLFFVVVAVVVVVVVEWLINLKELPLLEEPTSAKTISSIFVGKMCVFVSRPIEIVTFPRRNDDHPNWIVDFSVGKHTFRKNMDIVEDFVARS